MMSNRRDDSRPDPDLVAAWLPDDDALAMEWTLDRCRRVMRKRIRPLANRPSDHTGGSVEAAQTGADAVVSGTVAPS